MQPPLQLARIAKNAADSFRPESPASDVLPFVAEALALVDEHSSYQAEFERVFMDMPSYAPPEFVEACMHALRWPNVEAEFRQRQRQAIASNNWRSEPVYRHLLEAFAPDWENASDLYAGFFENRVPPVTK